MVKLISETGGTIHCRSDFKVITDFNFNNHPEIDLLIVPGGWGTRKEVNNVVLIEWLKGQREKTQMMASVCTGSFLLAEAGLLHGLEATTHWASIERMKKTYPKIQVKQGKRFIISDQGRIVTSAGIAAGIDMSLFLVSELVGECWSAGRWMMARKRKYTLIIVFTVSALVLIGAALAYYSSVGRYTDQLFASEAKIQQALLHYTFDTAGRYPASIEELLEKGYLDRLPDNPYSDGTMQPIAPDAPWAPGDFVYIAISPLVVSETGQYVTSHTLRDNHDTHPTEIDSFLLVVYGPRPNQSGKSPKEQARDCLNTGVPDPDNYTIPELDQIDWDHVSSIMTPHEDYRY